MQPILFARCDAGETFGVAKRAVEGAGVPVAVWEALEGGPRPSATDFSGIVVFGSVYNVEHADERTVHPRSPHADHRGHRGRRAVPGGVLRGAAALVVPGRGGRQGPGARGGVRARAPDTGGDRSDPLLSHLRDGDMQFQWHMDTFTLPDGSHADRDRGHVVNQAYRVGDRTWGVQFHFEVDRSELQLWLHEFSAQEDLLSVWGKSAEQILAESDRYQAGHERRGREVFERFVRVAAATAGEPISS